MSFRKTLATAVRVMRQLQHDPRTLAILFIVPSALITILKYAFTHQQAAFNAFAPMLFGVFPMVMMFLVTSIATLRERRSGTLDRLMTLPISKPDFIFGYAAAFSVVAFLQAVITAIVSLDVLHVPVLGGTLATIVSATVAALLGTALGLFLSAFAKTEFQSIQFMPAFIFPQLLVCGLFVARDQMATALQWFADVMPLTYSVDGMKQVTLHTTWTTTHTRDVLLVLGFTIAALILGSITIRRQEKP